MSDLPGAKTASSLLPPLLPLANMAVHVKHLNADSTFLLTFTTASTSESGHTSATTSNGSFTVLTDPWLADTGAPQYHPRFAFAARKIPAHISHLSQIDPPDVVVISQVNTDHCHEETLRQLPADLPHTTILAHPDAAKKIRSWRYFKSTKIHAMPTYSDKNHNTVIRFSIPPKSPGSTPGEATVTLIRQPRDMTKLHSAVAITYRPPTDARLSLNNRSPAVTSIPNLHSMRSHPNLSEPQQPMTYQLRSMLSSPALRQHQKAFQPNFPAPPLTPPETPPESEQDPQERPRSPVRPRTATPPRRNFHLRNPSDTPSYRQRSRGNSDATTKTLSTITRASSISEAPKIECLAPTLSMARPKTADGHMLPPSMPPPTAPLPPIPDTAPFSPPSSYYQSPISPATTSSMSTSPTPASTTAGHPISSVLGSAKTLSVLYAPHGITYSSVKPYATTHLVQTAALPLTLVMHPFDRLDNPWWLGGNISAGVPGGVEIVRKLMGKHWVKTHDEEKEETGFGLKMLKKGRWTVEEVEGMLETGIRGARGVERTGMVKKKGAGCEIRELECGEEMLVGV